jgi:hypothetical protein
MASPTYHGCALEITVHLALAIWASWAWESTRKSIKREVPLLAVHLDKNLKRIEPIDRNSSIEFTCPCTVSSTWFPTASHSSPLLLCPPRLLQPRHSRSELHLVRQDDLSNHANGLITQNFTDPTAFTFLQRAAKLSSAAYSGCLGSAFDVTITKQIYNGFTDTNVSKSTRVYNMLLLNYCRAILDTPRRRKRFLSLWEAQRRVSSKTLLLFIRQTTDNTQPRTLWMMPIRPWSLLLCRE